MVDRWSVFKEAYRRGTSSISCECGVVEIVAMPVVDVVAVIGGSTVTAAALVGGDV